MDFKDPQIDFVQLANSMGVTAERIDDPAQIGPAVKSAMASSGPNLLDVVVDGSV